MTDVVLPCLDEAAALPDVLSRIPAGYRVIVVDNGSTDGSPEVAAAHGALVVREPRRGFGFAVHAGVLAAHRLAARRLAAGGRAGADDDVLCVMDADGSFDAAQLRLVADPVHAGTADLVLGRRRPTSRGAWPAHARLGNVVLAGRLRRAAGLPLRDLGPMRAARRSALLALDLRDRRFGYPLEMVLRAARAGWRVAEVDVDYAPRAAGTRSKVTGTVLGTARAVRDMAAVLATVDHRAGPA